MKKATQNAIKAAGLQLMDKAVTKRFGISCETKFSQESKQFETAFDREPDPAVLVFIAGYQKALSDIFIAARL
jgi:hypothetical protein